MSSLGKPRDARRDPPEGFVYPNVNTNHLTETFIEDLT